MDYDRERGTALAEEAAGWAVNSEEASDFLDEMGPLAYHFAELSGLMASEVLITMAKALQAGYYFGKYGLPEDRVVVPEVFDNAFEGEEEESGK